MGGRQRQRDVGFRGQQREQGRKGGSSDWMEEGVERGDDALKSSLLGEEHSRSRLGHGRARR